MKITINEENVNEEDFDKHELYSIDKELFYLDNKTGDIFRIDFPEQEELHDNKDEEQDSVDCKEEDSDDDESEEDEEEESEEEESKEDVIDLDLIKNETNAIKNKTIEKGGCDMDFEMKETFETKPDGAESMKERRITQCMEETGKSRKACTDEVRKKMHKKDAEAVNPEDMKEGEHEEVETKKEVIEEVEAEKKDTVEICPKELDMLKKDSEELKTLKDENEKTESVLESLKADFLVYKKKIDDKEEAEKEFKRQEAIKRISYDFDLPEEDMKEDTIEELEKLESRLEKILKRDTKEEEEETFGKEEDFKDIGDRIHKRYFLEV